MEKLEYQNPNGESITFDYRGDFLIDSYNGLTAADVEPVLVKGYQQDGYTLETLTFGTRKIEINFLMKAKDATELYSKRRMLAKVFNPALGQGTLRYTNNFIDKSIKCYCSVLPTPIERYGLMVMINLELTATNPLWFDNAESVVKLDGRNNGLKFPLKFNHEERFALKGTVLTANIVGDVASPIKAVFTCGDIREAVNPYLINTTTGERIEVQTTITDDEQLVITTGYGEKDVQKIKTDGSIESAYHLIDVNSKFFSLQPGKNRINFSAFTGDPLLTLYWRNYYIGV